MYETQSANSISAGSARLARELLRRIAEYVSELGLLQTDAPLFRLDLAKLGSHAITPSTTPAGVLFQLAPPVQPVFPNPPPKLAIWSLEGELRDASLDKPGLKENTTVTSVIVGDDGIVSHEVRFLADYPDVIRQWNEYIVKSWRPWADGYNRWQALHEAYLTLFSMYQTQEHAGGVYETVALLNEETTEVKVTLSFDHSDSSISVSNAESSDLDDALLSSIAMRRRSLAQWVQAIGVISQYIESADGDDLSKKYPALMVYTIPELSKGLSIASNGKIDPLYLPLATDSCQMEAIRKAISQPLTIVNGPPSSGKTQTAVNLLCNLVTSGNRVLVTSHSVEVLRAFSERLPAKLHFLTSGRSSGIDVNGKTELLEELARVKEVEAKAVNDLLKLREAEAVRYGTLPGGYSGTPREIAIGLSRDETHLGWLPFEPKLHEVSPLSDSQAKRLCELFEIAKDEGVIDSGPDLLELELLPTPDTYAALVNEESRISQWIVEFAATGVWPEISQLASELTSQVDGSLAHQFSDGVERLIQELDTLTFSAPIWVKQAVDEILDHRRSKWTELASATERLLTDIDGLSDAALSAQVTGLEGRSLYDVMTDAQVLHSHVSKGKSLKFSLFRSREVKDSFYIISETKIDGKPCRDLTSLELLIDWVDASIKLSRLREYWSLYMAPRAGTLQEQATEFRANLNRLSRLIAIDKLVQNLESLIKLFDIPTPPLTQTDCIDALEKVCQLVHIGRRLTPATNGGAADSEHPLLTCLRDAIGSRDITIYSKAYTDVCNIRQLRTDMQELQSMLACLGPRGMSLFRQFLSTSEDWPSRYNDFRSAWDWARVKGWLWQLTDPLHIERASQEAEDAISRARSLSEDIVRSLASEYCSGDSSLVRISTMSEVVDDVALGRGEDTFDTVIVLDGGSAGFEACLSLFLGQRLVIFGDESVGVQAFGSGNSSSLLTSLSGEHGVDTQLVYRYNIAPELTDLANSLVYHDTQTSGVLTSMQVPSGSGKKPPATSFYVPLELHNDDDSRVVDDVNEREALAIVAHVKTICEAGMLRRGIAIVSTEGKSQAEYIRRLLVTQIGASAVVKNRIFIGTPGEVGSVARDAVFISMVVTGEANRRAQPQTDLDSVQGLKSVIAVAGEQLLLVHSIALDRLSRRCCRHHLLEYLLELGDESNINKNDICQLSRFAEDILGELRSKGYDVTPKTRACGYDVDLLIRGIRASLAVECRDDGWQGLDKYRRELLGQMDLSRIGLSFCRLGASSYYLNAKAGIAPLWRYLQKLGITPTSPNVDLPSELPITPKALVNDPRWGSDILSLFNERGFQVIDKRSKGGCLWVVGDRSLGAAMDELRKVGIYFHFAPGGSRVTSYMPAWYGK